MGNHFQIEREAAQAGAWDERPMFGPGVDPQLCLSKADRAQPFYLICEHDTVLAVSAGTGQVAFALGPVRYHTLEPGDFVYVPGGMPHRIVPHTPLVTLRFKAEHPGLEGVAWYCPTCQAEVHREQWDTAEQAPQAGYLRASMAFNADSSLRACACGTVHPPVDIEGNRWEQLVNAASPQVG